MQTGICALDTLPGNVYTEEHGVVLRSLGFLGRLFGCLGFRLPSFQELPGSG